MEISKIKISKQNYNPPLKNSIAVSPERHTSSSLELPSVSANKYLINFTGLNRTLGKTIYAKATSIRAEVENFPKSSGVVGNLPAEWVQKIPKENRKAVIKELYHDFKKLVEDLEDCQDVLKAQKNLNDSLFKSGIIDKEKVSIKYLGKGAFGQAYHLQGLCGDNYVLKVFKQNNKNFQKDSSLIDMHGNYAELNRAAFWQKNAGKNTQMVRFYFGDIDAGYMVNKFIGNNTPVCKKYVPPKHYGLDSVDVAHKDDLFGHNKINGFQIDYGGIKIIEPSLVKNKKFHAIFKKFLTASEKERMSHFNALIDNADNPVKKAVVSGLYKLPEEERAIYFNKLSKNSDVNIKKELVHYFDCLPMQERTTCFKQLAETPDSEVKKALAWQLASLPDADKVECFMQLADNADSGVKKALVTNFYFLPVYGRALCFKEMVKTSDAEIKKDLVFKLYCLPDEERAAYFKLLAENANSKLRELLYGKVFLLPKENQIECKKMVESSDFFDR